MKILILILLHANTLFILLVIKTILKIKVENFLVRIMNFNVLCVLDYLIFLSLIMKVYLLFYFYNKNVLIYIKNFYINFLDET